MFLLLLLHLHLRYFYEMSENLEKLLVQTREKVVNFVLDLLLLLCLLLFLP